MDDLKQGMPVPYLKNPPKVIDISVGRQLFVDDFLVESHNLYKVFHQPKKYEGNPVMFPETPMEKYEKLPCAVPKDGGMWFDRDEKIYKMWYEAGWLHKMAYATSRDGFASLGVENDGFIRTRKLTFKGKRSYFFINAQTENNGCITVEIKNENGKVLCKSKPWCGDSTKAELDFGDFDLASLEGKVIKLEFYVGKGRIYSFWFSKSENGESDGFDGAGTDE